MRFALHFARWVSFEVGGNFAQPRQGNASDVPMKIKSILLVSILVIFTIPAVAQETEKEQENNQPTQYETPPTVPFYLKPLAGIGDKIKKAASSATINLDIKLINKGFGNNSNFLAEPAYQSAPSYIDGYYTRVEKYLLDLNAGMGSVGNAAKTILSFVPVDLNGQFEMLFARQFGSQGESLDIINHPPYNPLHHLPFDAKTAIEGLQESDFFSMRINAALLFVAGGLSWGHYVSVDAMPSWLLNGEFYVLIYRMPNNHVSVKFIGLKKNGPQFHGAIALGPNYGFLGWRVVPNILKHTLTFNIFSAEAEGLQRVGLPPMKNGILFADYNFDLNNNDAIAAYNELFSKFYIFDNDGKFQTEWLTEQGKVINPFNQNVKKAASQLIVNFMNIDRIYMEDAANNIPDSKKRINRVARLFSDSADDIYSTKWGFGDIYSNEKQNLFTSSNVAARSENDQDSYSKKFLYQLSETQRFWWNLYKSASVRSMAMLCDSDVDFSKCNFQGLGITYERTDTNYSAQYHNDMIAYVYHSLPSSLISQIPWGTWLENRNRTNAYVKLTFLFKRDALLKAKRRTSAQLVSEFYDYLKYSGQGTFGANSNVDIIAKNVGIILDPSKSDLERAHALLDIRENKYFHLNGVGYLVYLLRDQNIKDVLYVNINLSSKDDKAIHWKCGSDKSIAPYENFLYQQALLNNRSIDPRINDVFSDKVGYLECK